MAPEYKVSWRPSKDVGSPEAVRAFLVTAGQHEYYFMPFRGQVVRYNVSNDWWEVAYFIEKEEGRS